MKVLVTLAVLCFLQVFADHVIKDDHKPDQQNQAVHIHKPDQQSHASNSEHQSNQHANKEQHVAAQPQHAEQQAGAPVKPNVMISESADPSKVSVEIPPKVQHIVTQVSQHIPQVVAHHVASQQRMVRSVKNRLAWQDMQVNAVENPGKCEFICHQQDLSVCGYNGRCYWQFESQCDLSTYNCLNTDKIFQVVDFAKCQDIGAPKCYRGDL